MGQGTQEPIQCSGMMGVPSTHPRASEASLPPLCWKAGGRGFPPLKPGCPLRVWLLAPSLLGFCLWL